MPDQHQPTDRRATRLMIEGNVQGVGFRNWTQKLAGQLGLSGWVRNRRDGSVEILFCGTSEAIQSAIGRCRVGPRSAKVTELTATEEPFAEYQGFDILPGL